MKRYRGWIENRSEAFIPADTVVDIIQTEINHLLGCPDRYIDKEGRIMEEHSRFNNDIIIRDATEEEKELYHALRTTADYFRKVKPYVR